MAARSGKNGDFYECVRRHNYRDCDSPTISRKKVDETILAFWLSRHFSEDEERERLLAVAQEKSAEARSLAAQADREEAEAQSGLVRVKEDYKRGAITAEQWQQFEAELAEEATASRNRADQLRARAFELDAEAHSVDVETQLVARLATIMRTAAGR